MSSQHDIFSDMTYHLFSLVKDPGYFMMYMFNERRNDLIKRAVEYQQSEFFLTNLSQSRYQQLNEFMKENDGKFGNEYGQFVVTKKTNINDTDDDTGCTLVPYDTYSLSFRLN